MRVLLPTPSNLNACFFGGPLAVNGVIWHLHSVQGAHITKSGLQNEVDGSEVEGMKELFTVHKERKKQLRPAWINFKLPIICDNAGSFVKLASPSLHSSSTPGPLNSLNYLRARPTTS